MAALCMKCKWSQDLKEGLFNILVPAQEASQSFGYSSRFFIPFMHLSPVSNIYNICFSAWCLEILKYSVSCDLRFESNCMCKRYIFGAQVGHIENVMIKIIIVSFSSWGKPQMQCTVWPLFRFSLNNPGRNLMEIINYVAQKAQNFLVSLLAP